MPYLPQQELFEKAGIGIPHEDMETNDVCTFGFMVAEFLGAFRHASENYSDSPPRYKAMHALWFK